MKNLVEKRGGKVIVRPRDDDASVKVRRLADVLLANDHAALTQRQRDLLLLAIAQRIGAIS